MNLIKHATVSAPYRVSMHVKWIFNWIQYGRLAGIKVSPQPVKMQISRPVDKCFTRYLLYEFDEACHSASTLLDVSAYEIVFRLDPIWPPDIHIRVAYKM